LRCRNHKMCDRRAGPIPDGGADSPPRREARRPCDMAQCTPLTRSISLRQLCPGAKFFGADDIIVSSVAADSREVADGDLFAALPGTRTDGHHHIDDALRRGAVA